MLTGALIGFGKIAQNSHLAAYNNPIIKEKVSLVSVVEPNDVNREESKKKYPHLKFYKTIDDLLKSNNIDFIDVTTPPKFHKEVIEAGIKSKLNIISEKPFTLTLNEADDLYSKLKDYEKRFIPCHQYKYLPLWKEFKKQVEEIGSTDKILLQFSVFRQHADPGLEIFNNPWRINKDVSGGGILADTGVHYLYLSIWMLGKPLNVTTTTYNLAHPDYKVEDTAITTIEFERGISQITLTWGSNSRLNSANLVSPNVSLKYNGGIKLLKSVAEKEEELLIPDPSDKANYTLLYVSLFKEFINKVENNLEATEWIDEAYQSIKLLEACYRSAEEQRTINL